MKRTLITCVIGMMGAGCLFAQPATSFSDTIPYTLEHGKMIINASINGHAPSRFILDTGGRNMLVADTALMHDVKPSGVETVGDVNSYATAMQKGGIQQFTVGQYMQLSNMPVLITPNHAFYQSLKVAGILGGEAFANVCLTIDAQQEVIILDYPYRPRGISRNEGIQMNMGQYYHSILPFPVGNKKIMTLFDTGMAGFFSLVAQDYEKLMDSGVVEEVTRGNGFFHVGVGGIQATKAEEIHKVTVREFTLAGKEFRNIGSLVTKRQIAILGVDLIKYGKVVLDYPRSLFFFIPYDKEVVDLKEETKSWNLKILPIVDHFEITATLGEVPFKYGDRVWNINGTDLTGFPMNEGMIMDLMDGIETEEAWIMIGEDKNNLQKVTIKKI